MCVGSVGVIHGSKYMKNVRKHTFWTFLSDFYRYNLSSTGRTSVLVIFGQVLPVELRVLPVEPVLFFQFRPVFVFWP